MGFTALGGNTRTILLHTENHKCTVELVAGADLVVGQPVKLDATGKAVAWAKADGQRTLVGIAVFGAKDGEYTTIWSRGYSIVNGIANATQNAGPVTFEGMSTANDETNGYAKYGASSDDEDIIGWALDPATDAGEIIRVLIKD